ncbi:hypothetical protein PSPO01_16435 [Paraphaeosphaeria sporulosa]
MSNHQQLFEESRLRPEAWEKLLRSVIDEQLIKDGNISIEEKLLTFLTISRNFHEVLNAMLRLYKIVVKGPSIEVPEQVAEESRFWPYFKDCLGALDGTHIPIFVPQRDHKRYRNRYGDLTQNVLAVVDFDMNFLYVLAGWEGSAHDGKVL